MRKLRVAMIATPWLSVPPLGYGGIEAVVKSLVKELKKLGVDVELFSVGTSKIRGVKNHYIYEKEQYIDIHRPGYESVPINFAHVQYALNYIAKDGKFDIIHDHNGYIGPAVLGYATGHKGIPPVIHTLHGPPFSNEQTLKQGIPDNTLFYSELGKGELPINYVAISETLHAQAPKQMAPQMLPPVHNAVDTKDFIFKTKKKPYFLTLARFSADKGQHIAAQLCEELGVELRMAGTVAGIDSNRQLMLEFSNPMSTFRNAADFKYYSDMILPYTIDNKNIRFIGNISGQKKLTTLANARALLFPIDWEEPFGMAVIEALASGTPVIAMNRGAMPEIIEHGVNGFLANSVTEFREYMKIIGDIDPENCRKSIESKFSSKLMAERYLERYKSVISRKTI